MEIEDTVKPCCWSWLPPQCDRDDDRTELPADSQHNVPMQEGVNVLDLC